MLFVNKRQILKGSDNLDIILRNGDKLYKQHLKKCDELDKMMKINFVLEYDYQNKLLKQMYKRKDYNVYGDDFKIEITPKNIAEECVLSIQDFNEDQCLESEISIGFNKDELRQFINLLQTVEIKL